MFPEARREGLVVQEAGDEVVVYDTARRRASTLNRTVALVWRYCDGRTSVGDMVGLLRKELDESVDERVVLLALKRLDKASLLSSRLPRESVLGITRRALLTAGLRLIMLPAVLSITCAPAFADLCNIGGSPPCSGNCTEMGATCKKITGQGSSGVPEQCGCG